MQSWRDITENVEFAKSNIRERMSQKLKLGAQLSKDKKKKKNKFKQPQIIFGAFKTYNETDFEELNRIVKSIKSRKVIENLDLEVLCSLFKGYSIFSVSMRLQVLKMIEEQMDNNDFEPDRNEDNYSIENNFLRRIQQTMMIPVPKVQNKFQKN